MSTGLTQYQGLLDVQSGELMEPGIGSVARCVGNARAMKQHVQAVIAEATSYAVALSEHLGTKTLHGDGETVTVTGGPSVDYDVVALGEALINAGCPQNRINAAIKTEITYKVDRSVLRQLAAANAEYAAAIERAKREVEKPYQVSVSLRRNTDDK